MKSKNDRRREEEEGKDIEQKGKWRVREYRRL
jgi:hypothetical protein